MQVTSPSAAPSATSFAVTVPLAASRSASAGEVPALAAAGGVAGQRGAAEQRLQAADVAARAHRPVAVDLDVPDVAGRPVGAAVHLAVEVDAAADAGADLDEQQVVDRVGHAAVPLADAHDVDVVVDHDRAAVLAGQQLAHRVAVPAGHDRRRHRYAVTEAHRPGHADAHRGEPLVRAVGVELREDLVDLVQDLLRPGADVGRPP